MFSAIISWSCAQNVILICRSIGCTVTHEQLASYKEGILKSAFEIRWSDRRLICIVSECLRAERLWTSLHFCLKHDWHSQAFEWFLAYLMISCYPLFHALSKTGRIAQLSICQEHDDDDILDARNTELQFHCLNVGYKSFHNLNMYLYGPMIHRKWNDRLPWIINNSKAVFTMYCCKILHY